ncbi:hypothetical protein LEP1GSC088_4708 [Leptospira interrogans str. L1207]|nr:hypothetical protein LEP1GSC088_4708 [Leptospira interrogans str. L1207]
MRLLSIFICFIILNVYSLYSQELEKSGFIVHQKFDSILQLEDFDSLDCALKESESYYQKLSSNWKAQVRKTSYHKNQMLNSLKILKKILREKIQSLEKFNFKIRFYF